MPIQARSADNLSALLLRLTVLLAAIAALIAGCGGSSPKPLTVTIHDVPIGRSVPRGFVGLSIEYWALPLYTGPDPTAVNPVFEQLLRNINPGQHPQLRIGGDSTDRTWWPVPGMARPGGIRYGLTPHWASVTRALAHAVGARLVLGINMEAHRRRLSRYEAHQLVSRIGARSIRALELGNEPELYGVFPLYQRDGHGVKGRPRDYAPADFTREFTHTAKVMPPVPLAGPTTGAPMWEAKLHQFVKAEPNLSLVTIHRYATRGCLTSPSSPQYHSIPHLLSSRSTRGLAAGVAPYVGLRGPHTPPLRVDELNSVNCGGVHGVSDTFASALWSLDTLLQLARVGVWGVNFHTFPGARYEPFVFRRSALGWRAVVKPLYYGMLMFAQAAPPGAHLLAGSGRVAPGLDVFGVRSATAPARAVLINYSSTEDRTVALHLPGGSGQATVERLQAPSVAATSGVTIGGRSFGPLTTTGKLTGSSNVSTVSAGSNGYVVDVPAGSAAVVTPTG